MKREELNRWVEAKIAQEGISIRELGRRSGLPHSNISKVLNGKQNPALDFYVSIARVFEAVPEMLQVAGIISTEEQLEMSLLELFNLTRSLTPEEQAEISRFIEFMVNQAATRPKGETARGSA